MFLKRRKMRRRKVGCHHYQLVWTFVIMMTHLPVEGQYSCPNRMLIRPCTCAEKSVGLDVTCKGANGHQLREAIENVQQTRQTVWYLKLTNNRLPKLPALLLADLDVRNVLLLNSNTSNIDKLAFTGLGDKLETLDLSKNVLQRVPSAALETLGSLTSLNLNYNRIESIHASAFRGLISLLRLYLYGNKIKFIDNLAFLGIGENLTRLNLGSNELTSIPNQSLQNLTILRRLQVPQNQITIIIPEEFKAMGAHLDTLDLAQNLLQELPMRAFEFLPALSSLDLEGNRISYIHPEAFKGLEDTLEWLKLGRNNVDIIPVIAFQNLSLLRQMDLRGNNISRITEDAFWPYGTRLKYIYLQDNQISEIENGAFFPIKNSLRWLYLQSNRLATLHKNTFEHIFQYLEILDVHNNPFLCDCNIAWFREWMKRNGSVVVSMPRETRCESPKDLKGFPIADAPSDEFRDCSTTSSSSLVFPSILLLIYNQGIVTLLFSSVCLAWLVGYT
ncbi:uncharacterized protein LOC143257975 [Tachypleus tridentatus]|uniref:uncharacterized protein LOC143257975 n=1 Tax=Tachypleus tridentatus TaxID=6853 RepID=UPI003FD213EE